MRRFVGVRSQLIAVLVLLLSGSGAQGTTQSQADADLSGQVQVDVINTTVQSYSASKLVLGLTLAVSTKRDLTLEQIVLAGLRINGLPLYAAPLKQHLQLHAGDKTIVPDPLPVTVYLRDLDSVSPLERAISNGHTTLDGTAYATVRVNPLAALLLLSRHVEVAISLHEDVLPFTVPGGPMAKNASLTVLHATDKALHAISTTVNSGKDRVFSFRHDVVKQYAPHLMLAYARFEMRDVQGKTTPVEWWGVALTTAPDLLLVPREAIEPWKFDPEIADAIHSKRLSLNKASYDLWLWPASAAVRKGDEFNADTAVRLSKKQFSVVRMPDSDQRKVRTLEDSGQTQKVSVENRNSSSDLALLQLAKSASTFDALRVADDPQATQWDSVALFRFRGGVGGNSADPELIEVPARRSGNRIELGELVDSSAFGSPIVAPEGVIGIVQDENSGVVWAEAARALKLEAFQNKSHH